MGLLSQNPTVRRRQFETRKHVGFVLILSVLAFSSLFVLYSFITKSNGSSSCPSCQHNRIKRSINDETHRVGIREEDTTPSDSAQDFIELCTVLNNNQNITGPEVWLGNFYSNFYRYYFNDDNIPTAYNITESAVSAVSCNNVMKSLYGTSGYQINDIYWCDSTAGWPNDMNIQQRRNGGVILYFLGMLYMFVALAIVCDDYFVPALEVISEVLQLSPNVAGATFMAAGGSAPELFTSIIGVFVADSNVGIGTIVGSAVFNILFVLGACAFIVGMQPDENGNPTILCLTWFPLTRDTIFYVISLVMLILSFTYGPNKETVEWYESLILFSIYILYVTFMMNNDKIEKKLMWEDNKIAAEEEARIAAERREKAKKKWQSAATRAVSPVLKERRKTSLFSDRAKAALADLDRRATTQDMSDLSKYAVGRFMSMNVNHLDNSKRIREEDVSKTPEELAAEQEDESVSFFSFELPEKWVSIEALRTILLWPLTVPLKLTTPDVSLNKFKKYYVWNFTSSILWICVYSYLMVWAATRIGETYNIDSALMGLTFLAAGTSVPDLITSVLVAKEGHGDMAISSSIGSNIFDVTIGLPIPWLVYSAISGGVGKAVSSNGLGCSIGLLLIMLVTLILSILSTGWKMNKGMGFSMLILYAVFVAISLGLEYGYLTCPF